MTARATGNVIISNGFGKFHLMLVTAPHHLLKSLR